MTNELETKHSVIPEFVDEDSLLTPREVAALLRDSHAEVAASGIWMRGSKSIPRQLRSNLSLKTRRIYGQPRF